MTFRKLGLALALTLAAGSTLAADPSPSKKALIDKLVQLQLPTADGMARNIIQQPLTPLMQSAAAALQQQVPADKREATAKTMDAEMRKFIEDNVAYLKDKIQKAMPSTTGALLDERFTEDELKQILAWFESPVSKKFGQVGGELNKALLEKVVAEAGPTLDGRFKTLQATLAKQMGLPAPQPAPAKPAAPGKK